MSACFYLFLTSEPSLLRKLKSVSQFSETQNGPREKSGDLANAFRGLKVFFNFRRHLVRMLHFRSSLRSESFILVRFTTGLDSVPNNVTP